MASRRVCRSLLPRSTAGAKPSSATGAGGSDAAGWQRGNGLPNSADGRGSPKGGIAQTWTVYRIRAKGAGISAAAGGNTGTSRSDDGEGDAAEADDGSSLSTALILRREPASRWVGKHVLRRASLKGRTTLPTRASRHCCSGVVRPSRLAPLAPQDEDRRWPAPREEDGGGLRHRMRTLGGPRYSLGMSTIGGSGDPVRMSTVGEPGRPRTTFGCPRHPARAIRYG
jgi:hypothetical protein